MCTFIVRSSDSFKSLLASGIPNLKFDGISSSLESSNFEINTNGW